jgi:putative N6-adenine-specific DNA methylase
MSYPYQYYAVVVPGLEKLAARELASLSAHEICEDEGGVHFSGTMETLYRINLRARLVTRVLLHLGSFRAMSWPELFNKAGKLPWQHYLTTDARFSVKASCHRSRLIHSTRAAAVLADAVRGRVACHLVVDAADSTQQLHLRFDQDECTISIDASGERLDRRGYRLHPGKAPVRETLAAAIVEWMGWQPDEPLMVPMCGSGTFAIEAALMARAVAPGLHHHFPFLAWPVCKAKAWKRAKEKAAALKGYGEKLQITASDIDAEVVAAAVQNVERAAVGHDVTIRKQDFFGHKVEGTPGVMLCNPPFGIRIGDDTCDFYHRLGEQLQAHFQGWRVAVLCPDKSSIKALAVEPAGSLRIRHGGRWMDVVCLKP